MGSLKVGSAGAERKFWGLGWGLIYVVAVYFFGSIVVERTGSKSSWYLVPVFTVAALISVLSLATQRREPKSILKIVFYALHLLNLAYAIVFTVLGLIQLLSGNR